MAGFTRPTTTATPDTLFDYWLPRLSGPELRCLLFIVRRTFGFKRDTDSISLDQFTRGIATRAGVRLCGGTGLRSRAAVSAALGKLVERGLVSKEARRDAGGGNLPSEFRLTIDDNPEVLAAYGFRPPTTTAVPDELFDHWLAVLNDRELRVLLYIIRHTLGWRKLADTISPDQFIHGMRRRDGRVIDGGCGLRSVSVVYEALGALERHTLVLRERQHAENGSNLPSRYALMFEGDRPYLLSRATHTAEPDPIGDGIDPAPRAGVPPLGGEEPVELEEGVYERGGGGNVKDEEGGTLHGEGGSPAPPFLLRGDAPPCSAPANPQQTKLGKTAPTDMSRQQTENNNHHQQSAGGGVLHDEGEILAYPLEHDEVFVAQKGGGVRPVRLVDLVREDISATERNWGLRVSTECWYSAEHALGLGGDDWLPEEEERHRYHRALRREMEALYADIGAFSVAEALGAYFTADLVDRLCSDDQDELERQRGWVRYVRGETGRGLHNPAAFLRTRLESGQWPPRGTRRAPT